MFGDRWERIECLDMACHQGWFAVQAALRGARRVHGFDVRAEHVARASMISELAGLTNTSFEQRNLFDLDPESDGRYDLTLFLGILYHLDNPVGALKLARAMTKELCVIETQVARAAPELKYRWGGTAELRHRLPDRGRRRRSPPCRRGYGNDAGPNAGSPLLHARRRGL